MNSDDAEIVTLPSGRTFMPFRRRSAGILDAEELGWCRANGVAVAFDPAQQGWIPATARDDVVRRRPAASAPAAPEIGFRPWRADDLPVFRALLDDAAVWRYMPTPYPDPLGEDDAADLIAISALTDHHEVRAVTVKGRPVGQVRVEFGMQGPKREAAEISYWFGREHWGKGLGRTAVARASADAFARHPGLRRLFAWVHPHNHGSIRVLEAAGYTRHESKRADGWVHFVRSRPLA